MLYPVKSVTQKITASSHEIVSEGMRFMEVAVDWKAAN